MKSIFISAVLPAILLVALGACTGNESPPAHQATVSTPAPEGKDTPVVSPSKPAPKEVDAAGPTGWVHRAWTELLVGGCDVEQVTEPITARVLRNTPFAAAGHRFKSSDLTAFFTKEGEYKPADGPVQLDDKEAGCVAKLKQREKALREILDIPAPFEALLLRHHGIVVEQYRPADEVGEGDLQLCAWHESTTISKDDAGTWKIENHFSEPSVDGLTFEFGCVTECTSDGSCRGYEYS